MLIELIFQLISFEHLETVCELQDYLLFILRFRQVYHILIIVILFVVHNFFIYNFNSVSLKLN